MTDPPRTVRLRVAYDGRAYAGLVEQREQRTVVGALRCAIAAFDPHHSALRVASRTDAGVLALANAVAFDTHNMMPARAWVLGLARHLPKDVVVREAADMVPGYNPRFDTLRKRYRYLVLCDRLGDPLWHQRAWRIGGLSVAQALERLPAALTTARGEHDFRGFASARDQREHTVRTLEAIEVRRWPAHPTLVAIEIVGDGFLHNMVRILVGSAVDAARGRAPVDTIQRALASGNRRDAGMTAPAGGLYLASLDLATPGRDPWPDDGDTESLVAAKSLVAVD